MKVFYKYWVEPGNGKEFRSIEHNFQSHSSATQGYEVDETYKSKQSFLMKWFCGKYVTYDSFIKGFVSQKDNILSIASGRCINELVLIEEGYNVTCSDLDIPKSYIPSENLFKEFAFEKLNILEEAPSRIYDAIICIGLVWAFNKDEMAVFFKNVHKGIKDRGLLIIELSLSPDNFLSFLLYDIYLRAESNVLRLIAPMFGKSFKRIKEVHGYRYKTKEIIQIANDNRFEVIDFLSCEPLLEFQRSPILSRLIAKFSFISKLLTLSGANIPNSRLFALRRR